MEEVTEKQVTISSFTCFANNKHGSPNLWAISVCFFSVFLKIAKNVTRTVHNYNVSKNSFWTSSWHQNGGPPLLNIMVSEF